MPALGSPIPHTWQRLGANGDPMLGIIHLVQKMEDTTRVPKLFLAGGAVVFILLLFLFNEGARFVV